MAHKIKTINEKLLELEHRSSVIGLGAKRIETRTEVSQRRGDRETNSFFEKDENIFGREATVSNIVTTLVNTKDQESLSVMAIVGMGGLGKTTVAKSVYNKDEITKHFDKKIWLCVSEPFDVNTILIGMLESLDPTRAGIRSQDALLKNLIEELKGKKFILVLDDVWNEDTQMWNNLMVCLSKLCSAPGSNIIVTTRGAKVASVVETLPRCDLANLSEDECWCILKDRAFRDGSEPIAPDLEEIGREIARKCRGLPLPAKVLGSMLHKKGKDVWMSIQQSRTWDSREEDRIMLILKLSFDNLKLSSLKQCFAYCSMFEKDFEMEKNDLIQLWMAQGWLHPSPNQSSLLTEEIGEEYFTILAENSLFQDIRRDVEGNITCKMHDLVHDLAKSVSKSESAAWNSDKTEHKIARTRSLFPINAREIDFPSGICVEKFKALRVLKLQKTNIEELPISVGELKHLRYLDVSYTRLRALPESIVKLYNLQTLRMVGINPSGVEFPKKFRNLINLRHLSFNAGHYREVAIGNIGRLADLQTLPFFFVGHEAAGRGIEELAGLNQLRGRLIISKLERVRGGEEAKKANLVAKKNMHNLTFIWDNNREDGRDNDDEDVLEGLQPCPKLEYLEIHFFMGAKFPSWMSALNNLKGIQLLGCDECERMPALGCLPNLESLGIRFLRNLKWIGAEFYCCDAVPVTTTSMETRALFPALKTLRIHQCPNLLEWMMPTENVAVFPCLETLVLDDCQQLTTIPYHFPSLHELEISLCAELRSVVGGSVSISSSAHLQEDHWLKASVTLQRLSIVYCPKLESIPSLENFTALNHLTISRCMGLTSLPSGLPSCTSLEDLNIAYLPQLKSIPSLENLARLKTLTIGGFWEELDLFPDLPVFSQLESLRLHGWPKLTSLPQQIQHFTSLTHWGINSFEGLEVLPDWLGSLTSLTSLEIRQCGNLKYLPTLEAMQCLTNLQPISVEDCPLLKERCAKESGPEWPKISHIGVIDPWGRQLF